MKADIEIKKVVWKEYGEKEFKFDFPLVSTRSAIYRNVAKGMELQNAIDITLEDLSLHENAQRNKKKKYIHTITSR